MRINEASLNLSQEVLILILEVTFAWLIQTFRGKVLTTCTLEKRARMKGGSKHIFLGKRKFLIHYDLAMKSLVNPGYQLDPYECVVSLWHLDVVTWSTSNMS